MQVFNGLIDMVMAGAELRVQDAGHIGLSRFSLTLAFVNSRQCETTRLATTTTSDDAAQCVAIAK